MSIMPRTIVGRPLLVTVLVCLLAWITTCSASSVPTSSFERRSSVPDLNEQELDTYLQNHLHYDSRPLLNTMVEDPETIRSARSKYGSVYLYEPVIGRGETFRPYVSKQNGQVAQLSSAQARSIQQKLLEYETDGRQYGQAAKWLKHGRPFRPSGRFSYSWDDVWGRATGFQMPASKESVEWSHIRDALQGQRRVIVQDTAKGKQIAFRLTALGHVEFKGKDLAQLLHKRSDASPDNIASQKHAQDGIKDLAKRGMLLPGSSSEPPEGTLEYVLNNGRGLHIPPYMQTTPGGRAGMDRMYAHLLHFRKFPVFDVATTDTGFLQQALKDYGLIYVYGVKQGQTARSAVVLLASRPPIDPAPASRELLQIISLSLDYERMWGPEIHALVKGRPIERLYVEPRQGPTFNMGRNVARLDLHDLRDTLARYGSLNIRDLDRNNLIEVTLNDRGLADTVSDVAPHLLPPRLIKRMDSQPEQHRTDSVEYYQYLFTPRTRLQSTPEHEKEKVYAEVLHYRDLPVFYASDNHDHQARQALRDYGSFYIVGEPRMSRDEPVPVYRRDWDAARRPDDSESILGHLYSAKKFGQRHGKVAKMLAYGPRFSETSKSYLGKEDEPSWDDVWRLAKSMDARNANLLAARRHLNKHRIFKLTNPDTGITIGFMLDDEGNVLFREVVSHRLSKRMYNGREDPVRSFDYYVGPLFGASRSGGQLTEQEKQALFANDIHHEGVPILFPEQIRESKARKALDGYGKFWLAGRSSSNPNGPLQYIQLHSNGRFGGSDWLPVSYHVDRAAEFKGTYGEKAMMLKYGQPFAARQERGRSMLGVRRSYKVPDWDKVRREATLFHLDHSSLADMRRHLDTHNMMIGVDDARNKLYGFALDKTGKVLFHVLDEGPRFVKRMMPRYRPSQVEYYAFNGFNERSDLQRQTQEDRAKYFAKDLHYDGEPIFFPLSDPSAKTKAQQAVHDYGGFWVVGASAHYPREIKAFHYQAGGKVSESDDADVLAEYTSMNRYYAENGRLPQLLKYGPGFPARESRGVFRRYKTPSWDQVRAKAERVPINTDVATIWEKLHRNGMLAVTDEHQMTGYVLKKSGEVIHKVL